MMMKPIILFKNISLIEAKELQENVGKPLMINIGTTNITGIKTFLTIFPHFRPRISDFFQTHGNASKSSTDR